MEEEQWDNEAGLIVRKYIILAVISSFSHFSTTPFFSLKDILRYVKGLVG